MAALDDPRRLAALHATALLDSVPEPAFDRLVRLASQLLAAPVAAVSLVDDRRQFFKSAIGLGEPWASARGTPMSHSFCQHVVREERALVVCDAAQDPRVATVAPAPGLDVAAYLGVPLPLRGHILGAVCAIDQAPRLWTPREVAILEDLAAAVATEIELRATVARLHASEAQLRQEAAAVARQTGFVELLRATATEANAAATSAGAMHACVTRICEHLGWAIGHVYLAVADDAGGHLAPSGLWYLREPARHAAFRELTAATRFSRGVGLLGRVLATGTAHWMADVSEDPAFVRRAPARESRLRSGFAVPVLVGAEVAAVLELYSEDARPPDAQLLAVMADVGLQLGRVVERERARAAIERHAAEVQALSLVDELTGLRNRRGFYLVAGHQLGMAARSRRPALLFFADLDGLKRINDTLGHDAGDAAIRALGGALRAAFRDTDVIARLGGDELVVLAPDASAELGAQLADRVHAAVAAHNAAGRSPFELAVSIGFTAYDPDAPRTLDELIGDADARMYAQKRRHREPRPDPPAGAAPG